MQTSGELLYFNEPGSLSCRDLINQTRAEQACLTITDLPMSGDQANLVFIHLWDTFNPDQTIPGMNFSGSICVYQYTCAANNVTAYTDPHYLLGGKRRALLPPPPQEGEEWVAGRRKDDLMERGMELAIKTGGQHMERLEPGFKALYRGQQLRDQEQEDALTQGKPLKRAALSACA